jgi:iron complex outermembrane recepter protein
MTSRTLHCCNRLVLGIVIAGAAAIVSAVTVAAHAQPVDPGRSDDEGSAQAPGAPPNDASVDAVAQPIPTDHGGAANAPAEPTADAGAADAPSSPPEAPDGAVAASATPPPVEPGAPGVGTQAAEPSNMLEGVIVTADRRETNLQNTPTAISAFGPTVLQDRAVSSLRDLAGQIPNLSIARANISYTTQTYSLRGVGETDPIQEPVLAVYIDDVYQPRQIGSMPDFNDLERIEVLRGPQGTLYGRNSAAGAIRVITRDPGNDFRTVDSLTYGNFNAIKAIASVSGPIVRDRLYASVSFLHDSRDGIDFDPTLNRDVNRIDVDAARVKIRWTPDDRWDVQGTFNGLIDRSDSRSYIPAAQPGVTPACLATTSPWTCPGFSATTSYSEVQPYQHLNQGSASVRAVYSASKELKVKSITAGGGFDLNPVYYDNDGVAALVQKNLIHYEDGYFTQEVQVTGDYRWVNFSGGVFYLHERFFVNRDGYSRRNAMPTDPTVTPGNYTFLRAHNITTTNSTAAFGEVNLKITDRLTLTGGLRGTIEWKSFSFANSVLDSGGDVVAPSIQGDASQSWSALTPKAAVAYQWTPEVLQYVTYANGFRSGGFDNRATNLTLAQTAFNPEYVNSFEAGLKSEFFAHRLRANLAAFYDDYTDLQVSHTDPAYPGNSIRSNAAKAITEGAELETDTRLPFGLSVQLSGGYLYANYDTYNNCGGPGVNCGGHPLINAPRWNFVGGATLDIPLPIPGLVRLGADVEWSSEAFSSALSRAQDEYPAQTFVNGTLSWTSEDDHYVAILSGRNVLNSQKPVSASYTPSSGVLFYNFPDPATALFTLKYQQ